MCFHMLNLCWFKHKKIFECFKCFWKVFCSLKLKNFKNLFCPILATQSRVSPVACHSRELASLFWRLVREWKVQSHGLHKNFRGSAHDSLVGIPSSREKHLENFFKILSLSVLAAWPSDSRNAIFICVIVLDEMCFHMLNLCWFKHKKIFECFKCFWKVFCSLDRKSVV